MEQPGNLWDRRYAAEEFVFGTSPNDFLAAHVAALRPGTVCCIGDGEGRNGVFLAEQGFTVTSVDLSPVGLAKASRLAAERGVAVHTVAADLQQWVATDAGRGPWDNVVAIFCHLPSAVRATVYRALADALVPGGVFLLESYTPAQIGRGTGGPDDADRLSEPAQLRVELAGLTFDHLATTERDVSEGALHTGTAAVVQCIARKALDTP